MVLDYLSNKVDFGLCRIGSYEVALMALLGIHIVKALLLKRIYSEELPQ